MNPLDTMSTDFHQHVSVPSGPGVGAIIARGTRRRRGRTTANLAAVAAVMIGLGGAAVMAGRDPAHRVVAADDTAVSAAVDPWLSIDLDDAMSVLPRRAAAPVLVPTPVLEGWTVEPADQFSREFSPFLSLPSPAFTLTKGTDTATLVVSPYSQMVGVDESTGSISAPGNGTITRLGETIAVQRAGDGAGGGLISLTWNEPSSYTTSDSNSVIGVVATEAVAETISASVTFDLTPLRGAASPSVIDVGTDPEVVLAGTTDGTPWRILEVDGELVIELDGTAPEIVGLMTLGGYRYGIPGEVSSVSNDGTQINLVVMPTDATAAIETDGIVVALPSFDLGDGRRVAVAPIPAGTLAEAIVVSRSPVDTITVPLNAPAATGWQTSEWIIDPDSD